MLLKIFHDNTGKVLTRGWAIVYEYNIDDNYVLISDVGHNKIYASAWCDADEAYGVILKHKMQILNRSGKCLTFLKDLW
jgi:hypothetical protein